VLFLFADDLGWADLACQGSRYYETPNIDRLAARDPSSVTLNHSLFWHEPVYYGTPAGWGGFKQTPCSVIRKGDYKLTLYYDDDHCELYNLRHDVGEKAELFGQLPEKAEELKSELTHWLRAIQAPIPCKPGPGESPLAAPSNKADGGEGEQ
jgi:arylsulfatase A-like enzyme